MKKSLVYIATVALALVSCNEEELVNVSVPHGNKTLTASFEQDPSVTRMDIATDGNALTWSEGDEIAVIEENWGQQNCYSLTSGENTTNGVFTLNLSEDESEIEGVMAAFPYAAVNDDGTIYLSETLESSSKSGTTRECDLPMLGAIENGNIAFKHLAGVLKVNISNIPAGYNTLTVTASNPISGFFTVTTTDGVSVLTSESTEDADKIVTVTFAETTNDVLYIPLPVGTYASIVVSVSNGTEAITLKNWTNKEVKRAKVYATSADVDTYVMTEAALRKAVAKKGVVNLGANITITEPLVISNEVILNGNNFTIENTTSGNNNARTINVNYDGNVTIKDLNVVAIGERAINVIQNPAILTLDNVTATAANYAVNIAGSAGAAKVTIDNSDLTGLCVVNIGAIEASVNVNNSNITCVDNNDKENYGAISLNPYADAATVIVSGGKIIAQGDSYPGSISADGGSITIGNDVEIEKNVQENINIVNCYFALVYGNYQYVFRTLESALETVKTGETIVMTQNYTANAMIIIPAGVTIDGGDHSISTNEPEGASGKGKGVFQLAGGTIKNVNFNSPNTQYDIIVTAGGSVIENCQFTTPSAVTNADGTTTYGKRAIFTGNTVDLTGELTVNNCTFDDKVYAFNFSTAKNQMNITFTDCTLGGWLSGHGASHTFNNCVFTESGGYANYIPYCSATFNGCTFSEGFTISLKHGSEYNFNCPDEVDTPDDLNWDFSGDGIDNGVEEVFYSEKYGKWKNSITAGDEAPNWVKDGNNEYIPV